MLNDDEDVVGVFDTQWYKEVSSITTPGDTMRIYRENAGLTRDALRQKLGNLSRQKISDLERGKRNISKEMAKKLSRLFQVPVDRFF